MCTWTQTTILDSSHYSIVHLIITFKMFHHGEWWCNEVRHIQLLAKKVQS